MASKRTTVKGKVRWAKVFEANRDRADFYEDSDGMYTVDLYPADEAEWDKIRYSGTAGKPKEDKDGTKYFRFKRKHKVISRQGEELEWAGGPPYVTNSANQPWVLDSMGLIGNDSGVELTFETYKTARDPGTRMLSMKVVDHIPYESERDDGIGDEPQDDLDDHLPF